MPVKPGVFKRKKRGPYISPGGIFHGLYHEMPFRCPEIPFLLLVAVIASASDGKNGERIALRTKNGYPHILFGYYHPVRAVRFFFLRP